MRRLRLKPSSRFARDYRKLPAAVQKKIDLALHKLMTRPDLGGLNLEKLEGHTDLYTARVDRNYRLLLKRREDEQGTYYVLAEVADHKTTYRKR